jgi:hypothetical protein
MFLAISLVHFSLQSIALLIFVCCARNNSKSFVAAQKAALRSIMARTRRLLASFGQTSAFIKYRLHHLHKKAVKRMLKRCENGCPALSTQVTRFSPRRSLVLF